MRQFLARPDRHFSLCGHLDCVVTENRVDGAPTFMRGLRALFISDVHAVARTTEADFAALQARVAALAPDLLLLGGDYADTAGQCERFFRAFAALPRPPLGVYGVVGNNDREAWPDVEALRAVMARAGCELLLNASRRVAVNGGELILIGADEMKYGEPDFARLIPQKAEGRYRLLISHFPTMPDHPPELVVSGHTHGGQFNLLGVTPYFIGFERSKTYSDMRRYISGLHREGDARILVSKGIGASRIPLRVGVRPEINLLYFTA